MIVVYSIIALVPPFVAMWLACRVSVRTDLRKRQAAARAEADELDLRIRRIVDGYVDYGRSGSQPSPSKTQKMRAPTQGFKHSILAEIGRAHRFTIRNPADDSELTKPPIFSLPIAEDSYLVIAGKDRTNRTYGFKAISRQVEDYAWIQADIGRNIAHEIEASRKNEPRKLGSFRKFDLSDQQSKKG